MSCMPPRIYYGYNSPISMIKPALGYAFIIEDTKELQDSTLKEQGFVLSEEKPAGSTGVVYAINDSINKCKKCGEGVFITQFKKGDRVIFSKFVAEQIDLQADDIPKGRLRAVPSDMILGQICE